MEEVMRVFSNSFVTKQTEIFKKASTQVGETESLLNKNKTEEILNYMALLKTDEGKRKSIIGLLKLIHETKQQFKNNYKSIFKHPYVNALDEVKTNIIDAIQTSHPELYANYSKSLRDAEQNQKSANYAKTKDVIGMIACGLWTVPQKVLSFPTFPAILN